MTSLSSGQKRHQKELRRKKRLSHRKEPSPHRASTLAFMSDSGNPADGHPLLSETIWNLATDLADAQNDTEIENAISFVVNCWNMTLPEMSSPDTSRKELLHAFKDMFPAPENQQVIEDSIERIVATKHLDYANDHLYIMDFNLTSNEIMYSLNLTTICRYIE